MQKTNISYLEFTWNPGCGCPLPIPSAGCANCWARDLHDKRHRAYLKGMKLPVQYAKPFHELQFFEDRLTEPLRRKEPTIIGVQFMGDLFAMPFEWIDRVFAVMALCPQHEFKVLTKRAGRMREYCTDTSTARADNRGKIVAELGYTGPLECLNFDHVHKGVTVENQKNVGRIDDLIQTPAAKRFVSFEPLLESVEFTTMLHGIDYAFIGCESGPRARLCTLGDIRDIMHLCRDELVMQHVKQIPLNGKCNKDITQWPKEFQVREV